MIVGIPGVTESLWYKTWYNLFETHTPFVFALSTFINVSTLERRVKTLSRAAIRQEAIERELTLGKAVQDAFFQIPELPTGIRMAYSHEAAQFVSGDILFSHWDRSTETVAMVLCDVTGHGVQAALKASICSAICSSIWEHSQHRPGDEPAQKLEILHSRVSSYLTKTSGSAEVLAMVGCELDLRLSEIRLYRANGIFPLLVAKSNGQWQPKILPLHSGVMSRTPIDGPCFIVLFSDGIVEGPRTMRRLVSHIEDRVLATTDKQLDASTLKELVLSFEGFVETNDDKTLAVVELDAEAAQRHKAVSKAS
jgi:serine phosphatase RsbU (regulator of sigma subunit)